MDSPSKGIIGEAFRNYPLNFFMIMYKSQFEDLKLTFESKEDPLTKQPFSLDFDHSDFATLDGDCLFKLAARAHINEDDKNNAAIAVKYQVLSKDTAFIGVIKQDQKVIGETQKVTIEPIFVPKKIAPVVSYQPSSYSYSSSNQYMPNKAANNSPPNRFRSINYSIKPAAIPQKEKKASSSIFGGLFSASKAP